MDKNSKIEVLRQELVLLANVVEKHEEVAEKAKISTTFLRQIRQGKNAKTDNEKNRKLLTQLINFYRKIGRNKIEKLTEVVKK